MIRRMTRSPIALPSYQKAIGNGNRERQIRNCFGRSKMPMIRRRDFIVLLLFPECQKRFLDNNLDVI
jgi:hypothetical protein